MHTHVERGTEFWLVPIIGLPFTALRQSLAELETEFQQRWLARELWGRLLFPLFIAGVTSSQLCSDFYVGAGDLTSGPHASRARALTHRAMSLAQKRHIFAFFKYYAPCERTRPYEPNGSIKNFCNITDVLNLLKQELEVIWNTF